MTKFSGEASRARIKLSIQEKRGAGSSSQSQINEFLRISRLAKALFCQGHGPGRVIHFDQSFKAPLNNAFDGNIRPGGHFRPRQRNPFLTIQYAGNSDSDAREFFRLNASLPEKILNDAYHMLQSH